MSSVHLALDLSTGTECALKRLDPEIRRLEPDQLRREFELLARVRHPAVVKVFELGFAPDGSPFITMEVVPGVPAHQSRAAADWRALCHVAAHTTQGLEALHAAGVVHGDLKPQNLLVVDGAGDEPPVGVRLVDFGLGGLLDRERPGSRGTPGFVAPEVEAGRAPDVGSDLYGLGATLYAIATGAGGLGTTAAETRHAGEPVAALPLEEAGLPAPLVELILRLMAPVPTERPRGARDVRRELETLHPPVRRTLAQRLQLETVVGRGRELGRVERWLASPNAPATLLLWGEPGVGKSALIGEIAARAALEGRVVIRLSASAVDNPIDLVHVLLARLAAEAGDDADRDERLRHARDLTERRKPALGSGELDLLVEAGARWADRVRSRGVVPLVLLDDGERLSPAERSVLRRLALHGEGGVLRWVWASRSTADGLPEDARVLVDAGEAELLTLDPLDREQSDRLVAMRLHEPAPAELCDVLWERSSGHPGLLVESLCAAAESGALSERDGGLVVDGAALHALAPAAGFEASLLVRLARLSESARDTAAALAALDRPAGLDELAALAAAAGPALSELRIAGLLSDDGDRFSLRPAALGRRLLASMDGEERRRRHRAALARPALTAGERFVHLRGAGDPRAALTAAAEAVAAGTGEELVLEAAALADAEVPDQAQVWLERAGRTLIEQGRHRSAIPHLERALELGGDSAERQTLWHLLSTAYLRAGWPEQVQRAVERGLAEGPSARHRSFLLSNEASRLATMGRLDPAEAAAREAVQHAAGDDDATGIAALTLGGILQAQRRLDEAEAMAAQAQQASSRAGNRLAATRALGLLAAIAWARQDLDTAERRYGEAIEIARRDGLRPGLEELLMSLSYVRIEAGCWSRVNADLAEALRIALEDGRAHSAAVAMLNLAVIDGLTGHRTSALRRSRASIRMVRQYVPRLESSAWRSLAQALRTAGAIRRAERAARRAIALARAGSDAPLEWARIEYGRDQVLAGRWSEAGAVWDLGLEHASMEGGVAAIVLAALSGRAALRRRDHETAASRLARCEAWLGRRTASYAEAHVLQLGAEIALAAGRIEDGIEQARRTLAAYGALPAPADRATAALEFARLAEGTGAGSRVPVGEWLQDAAATFERLGDHRARERTLALTVKWLRASGVPASIRDRDLIRSVSRLLDSLQDLPELARRAMALVTEQLHAERGVLLLADPTTGTLEPVVERGAVDAATMDEALGFSRRAVERVRRSGGSLLVADAPSDPESVSQSVMSFGVRSIVCVPLFVGGKVVGAVYLDAKRTNAFSAEDRGLLEGFAHLMAIAIEKSRGHEEVRRENEQLMGENLELRREMGGRFQPASVIGRSAALQKVLAVVERAAQVDSTVLITGENGTGKEMIARILHHHGRRRRGPFVAVNCAAITDTLLEAELFGIKANFATNVRASAGRFVQADGGTLFLDEIALMPVGQQVALLSVLENREVTPVGGGEPRRVDVRIIAATSADLRRLVEARQFREDLFHRLNVIHVHMPPLREHKIDIPVLAEHFARQVARDQEREVPEFSSELLGVLMQSDWPGNVRELRNYVERLMAMTPGRVLQPTSLPYDLSKRPEGIRGIGGKKLKQLVADLEARTVLEAMERSGGNQAQAARELGIKEQALRYRLRKYEIERSREIRRVRRNAR